MELDDEANAAEQAAEMGEPVIPSTSPGDPRTYDPTQGQGSPGWQAAVKRQMEFNAEQRRN